METINLKQQNFIKLISENSYGLNLDFIKNAFDFTCEAHTGQLRDSGEPYVIHPLHVAYILIEMKMDSETVAAGLLHDIVEDTNYTIDDIAARFGNTVALLVEGVTKIEQYSFPSGTSRMIKQSENFRKMLFSITKDIRVIIIKLADRLHNMRTLEYLERSRQVRMARETLDIYAPLANRFGLARIKWELEDLAFKYTNPEEYKVIKKIVEDKRSYREKYISNIIKPLESELKSHDIEANISGRSKHFYSIYRKNVVRKVPYDEIYDLAAIRIIVETIAQCYLVMGIIHQQFQPLDRVRDYIARPKPNGYQSLHTIVIGPKGKKLEIQIRTQEMHYIAEEGIAAHWRYKEFKNYSDKSFENEKNKNAIQKQFEKQINWIRNLLSNENKDNIHDLIEHLQLDLYPDIIVVMTPDGDFLELPKGASPLDFAFAIHTEVGLRCIGCTINGIMSPIKTELFSGDIVKIQTAKTPRPSKDWFNWLKTSHGRRKLKAYFNKKEAEDALFLGKEIFKKSSKKSLQITNEEFTELLSLLRVHNETSLYISLGKGEILFSDIEYHLNELRKKEEIIPTKVEDEIDDSEWLDLLRNQVSGIKIDDISNLMFRYAKCCNPVPGDDILGYTTRGKGITIHRIDCENPNFRVLLSKRSQRLLSVTWNFNPKQGDQKKKFQVRIKIKGEKRKNFLLDILNKMSKLKIDIDSTSMKNEKNYNICILKFKVQTKDELNFIIQKLMLVSGVHSITKS